MTRNIAALESELLKRNEGGVLVLSLHGPSTRNCVGPVLNRQIQAGVIRAEEDAAVRAIVITGADGFFSSGGNIRSLRNSIEGTMAEATANTDALNAMILAIRNCAKPVIAAVEGGAYGAGFALVLACDMIIASRSASFAAAYAKVGLTPDGGLTHFLSHSMPRQLVSELCFLGRPVTAERLAQFGLVNRLCAENEALEAALDLAGELASGPADALSVIKKEIACASINDLAAQLDLEARGINRARFGEEAREGLAAFLEKRRPRFAPDSSLVTALPPPCRNP